jgi:hypothetical protein
MEKGTLHFFFNEKLIPHFVNKIPSIPVHMGV